MRVNFQLIKYYTRHFFTAKRKGHGVHSPFVYQLCEEVFYNDNRFYDFELLGQVRRNLLKDNSSILIEDLGAGSKVLGTRERKIKDIAKHGISQPKQSELIYKLLNFLQPSNIIELGTSLGLTTLYLAKAAPGSTVHTVEGSADLLDFAMILGGEQNVSNINYYQGSFDEVLPELLNTIDGVDLLFVDGNHTYQATTKYFEQALSYSGSNSVFIFDDIYWSEGMTKAWEQICAHKKVTLSIDCFHFGLVFFRKENKEKVHLRVKI